MPGRRITIDEGARSVYRAGRRGADIWNSERGPCRVVARRRPERSEPSDGGFFIPSLHRTDVRAPAGGTAPREHGRRSAQRMPSAACAARSIPARCCARRSGSTVPDSARRRLHGCRAPAPARIDACAAAPWYRPRGDSHARDDARCGEPRQARILRRHDFTAHPSCVRATTQRPPLAHHHDDGRRRKHRDRARVALPCRSPVGAGPGARRNAADIGWTPAHLVHRNAPAR